MFFITKLHRKNNNKNQSKNSQKNKKAKTKSIVKKKARKKIHLLRLFIVIGLLVSIPKLISLLDMYDKMVGQVEIENTLNRTEFINSLKDISIQEYKKTGLLPSITISQAILESNWGRSKLTKTANNLYGIKADKSWKGPRVKFKTMEYYDKYVIAYFRKYPSWNDSVKDRSRFLLKNKIYSKAGLFSSSTYREQAQALEDAGYATTTNAKGEKIYADKLIGIIKNYNLYEIDYSIKIK